VQISGNLTGAATQIANCSTTTARIVHLFNQPVEHLPVERLFMQLVCKMPRVFVGYTVVTIS
jgi:hypothetical protein